MLKLAAIVSEYAPDSHADLIIGKFLRGFPCDDGLHVPRSQIVSLYVDQEAEEDISLATAEHFGVSLCTDIPSALHLGGGKLAVDGVLIVAAHGEYPPNEWGQTLYPSQSFFEEVAKAVGAEGKSVPVFSDGHLSYTWKGAQWMVQTAARLKMPLMAGSALPVCWRRPYLEYPMGVRLEAAVGIGHGPLEASGFAGLEMVQCMVERRLGGETGVEQVRCLEGDAVWEWLEESPVHGMLAESAARATPHAHGPWTRVRRLVDRPAAILLRHVDGLESAILLLNGFCESFAFAGLGVDGVQSCEFVLAKGSPRAHFSYLCRNVEEMFVTDQPSYPIERTLLTTGILAATMESRYRDHRWLPTPHLRLCYQATENVPYRPIGPAPAGASLIPWPSGL